MEFEIKDLDRLFETLDKFHDTLFDISNSLKKFDLMFENLGKNYSLFSDRFAKSLETIASEMVAENEALKI